MEEARHNFGPLLPKINGHVLGKFIYLRLNYPKGLLEIVSIENETIWLVLERKKGDSFVYTFTFLVGASRIDGRI